MEELTDKHEPFRVISDDGVEYLVIPYPHALVPSPNGSSKSYGITQYRLADGQPIVRLADDTFRLETGERLRIKGIPR
jgi:hypothetical protein